MMNFLHTSQSLFVGTCLTFRNAHLDNPMTADLGNDFLDVFDRCSFIQILHFDVFATPFFAHHSVLNCPKLDVYNSEELVSANVLNSFVGWLHSPLPAHSTASQRQICIVIYIGDDCSKLVEPIKKKFLEDSTPHKFVFRFDLNDDLSEIGRMENDVTGEVLFIKEIDDETWDLIRCPKNEEKTVAYEQLADELDAI